MANKWISGPDAEQISLEEARRQCKLDAEGSPPTHEDDPLLEGIIPAAREMAEEYNGRVFAPATYEVIYDSFPSAELYLPKPPVIEILSVTYLIDDGSGGVAEATMDPLDYTLDISDDEPAFLLPAYGTEWPTPLERANAVRVRYRAGYSLPGDSPQTNPLPKVYRAAMLLQIGHLYKNREAYTEREAYELGAGVRTMLDIKRLRWGMA